MKAATEKVARATARTDASRHRLSVPTGAAATGRAHRRSRREPRARTRIERVITPDDQARLIDRYAAGGAGRDRAGDRASATRRALFDVTHKAGTEERAGADLSALASLVAGHAELRQVFETPARAAADEEGGVDRARDARRVDQRAKCSGCWICWPNAIGWDDADGRCGVLPSG